PPTPFGLLEAVEGVFLGLKEGFKRSVDQVVDGLDRQKRQIGEDEQEMHGAKTFVLADARSGQMTLDMQPGKQLLDPQLQTGPEIFQGRFDLSLKTSDVSVMQGRLLFCGLGSYFSQLSYHKSGAFSMLLVRF
ncbi:MAG: hypothetical protein ACUVXF_07585, partial [Desulfobaccales bacterium]